MRRARKFEEGLRLALTRLVCRVLAFRLAANKDGGGFFAKALWTSVGRYCLWFRTSWRVRSGSASRVWRRWAGHMRSCRSEVKIKICEQRCFRSRHSKWRRSKKSCCVREYPSAHLCLLEFFLAGQRTIKSTLAKNAGRASAQALSLQFQDFLMITAFGCNMILRYALVSQASQASLTKWHW
jgi:hypothetical protein